MPCSAAHTGRVLEKTISVRKVAVHNAQCKVQQCLNLILFTFHEILSTFLSFCNWFREKMYVESLSNWMTNLWTFQLMGTFHSKTNCGSQTCHPEISGFKICHPCITDSITQSQICEPYFRSWQSNFAKCWNVHCFLRKFRTKVLIFIWFGEHLKIRNGTFTSDTVVAKHVW